ncbi:MAG: hypothetical protein JWO81_1284 [Alphaproteobacteria bacterium]|nr:hypothetical protein [Alphaproteobacteria bacterium]
MTQFPQRAVAVDDYLARLAASLRPLPEADRLSIVAEIESHITERLASGTPVDAALAKLGWPELFARGYLEDHELERALARSSPGLLLSNMLGRATRSIVALAAGFTSSLLFALGLAFLAIAILKPVAPAYVGLWTGPDLFALGFFAATPGRNELLGYWLIPLSLVASLGCYLLAQLLMRSCGRRLLRRRALPILS